MTPLSSHQLLVFLLEVATLLFLATALGRLAQRVGLPAVVGELLAGVLLGPSVLGHVLPGVTDWLLPSRPDQAHLLQAFSQFAVVLLVGVTGLHVDVAALWRRRRMLGAVSATSLSLPFVLGLLGGAVLPLAVVGDVSRTQFAVFVGVLLSLSSIPVVAKTLDDLGLLHRDIGQITMGSASMQDAVGWLMLSLSASVALHHGSPSRRAAVLAGVLVAFVAVAATVGRYAVGVLLRLGQRTARSTAEGGVAEPGAAMAAGVVVILLGAATSQAVGLEAVFGAFVAGVVLNSVRGSTAAAYASLRSVTTSVLAPVFLATAGLQVDAGTLGSRAAVVTLLLVLALATTGKLVGGYVGGRAGHLGHWPSLALGGALNARGVVEIVAAHVGRQAGLLTPTMYTVIVLVALATSVMAGPMLVWATARGDAAAAQGADRPLDRRVLDGGSARTRHIDPSVTSEGAPCAGTSMPSRPITSSSTRQADRASRAMSSRSREST